MSRSIALPGDTIASPGSLFGHGVSATGHATLAGVVLKTDRLVTINPLKSRYRGSPGDLVIGRIAAVESERWRVEIGSTRHAELLLGALSLPDGAQRRRTMRDRHEMRNLLDVDDLVAAEISKVSSDVLQLQSRSLTFGGKLVNGTVVYLKNETPKGSALVDVDGTLVQLIFGANRACWISKAFVGKHDRDAEKAKALRAARDSEVLTKEELLKLSSVRNVVIELDRCGEVTVREIESRVKWDASLS